MDGSSVVLEPTHTLTVTHRAGNYAVAESDADGRVVERTPWLPAPVCHDVLMRYVDETVATMLIREVTERRTVRLPGPAAPPLSSRAARDAANPQGTGVLRLVEGLLWATVALAGVAVLSVAAWVISSVVR